MSEAEGIDNEELPWQVMSAKRKLDKLKERNIKNFILAIERKQLVYVTESAITDTGVSPVVIAYLLSKGYQWGQWPNLDSLIDTLEAY